MSSMAHRRHAAVSPRPAMNVERLITAADDCYRRRPADGENSAPGLLPGAAPVEPTLQHPLQISLSLSRYFTSRYFTSVKAKVRPIAQGLELVMLQSVLQRQCY